MTHDFSVAYDTVWHFTCESIFVIIEKLETIKPRDIVLVPDYPDYPIDLIRRIIPVGVKIETRRNKSNPKWGDLKSELKYIGIKDGNPAAVPLCDKLIGHVPKTEYEDLVVLRVRLKNRRVQPISTIQELIDVLGKDYNVMVIEHPMAELCEPVIFDNCKMLLNPTYETQLSLFSAVKLYIALGCGSGDIYASIHKTPMITLQPHMFYEQGHFLLPKDHRRVIVLSEGMEYRKGGCITQNEDCTKIKSADILREVDNLIERGK